MLNSPDETAHVDYRYQVWHGELPNLFDGLHFKPGLGIKGFPVHSEAQHPAMLIALAPITASRQSPASISGPTTGAMNRRYGGSSRAASTGPDPARHPNAARDAR